MLIVAYLFLGGAGAGAFCVLACIDVHSGRLDRRGKGAPTERARRAGLMKRGYALSFAVLLLGAGCLLADLGRPEVLYLLFTRPSLSYISLGTYSLTVLLTCVFFLVVRGTFTLSPRWNKLRPVALTLGMAAALFVMAYTGVLLQSMNAVALWQSSWLIGLFVLSALSTGIALVLVCASGLELHARGGALLQNLVRVDLVVVVLELAASAGFLVSACASDEGWQSVQRLLVGDYAGVFVGGFVVLGLVIPGILDGVVARRAQSDLVHVMLAGLVLAGGLFLRLGVVNAGIHSSI